MKFDAKNLIIGALILVILYLVFLRGRRTSFADEISPPVEAPSPAPVAVPSDLASGLPSGAILPKSAEEACQTKYGDGWIDFSPTLCKKI
jgi:hypothetical protein